MPPNVSANSEGPATKKARKDGGWRQKCIDAFDLHPLPERWVSKDEHLRKLSEATDEVWKNYYECRIKHIPIKEKKADCAGWESDVDEDDDLRMSDEPSNEGVLACIKLELDCEVHDVKREMPAVEMEDAADLRSTLLETFSKKHTSQECDCAWDDGENPRSADYFALVFSPFALPRALRLTHEYYNRAKYFSTEFRVEWTYKLMSFGYSEEDDFKEICSNSFVDPSSPMEKIKMKNLTKALIDRLREWIFGLNEETSLVLDDFYFSRLLFATCGSSGFDTSKGDIGYTWIAGNTPELQKLKKEHGDDFFMVSWLEHRVRTICGALRPLDKHYVPYERSEEAADIRSNSGNESGGACSGSDDDEDSY